MSVMALHITNLTIVYSTVYLSKLRVTDLFVFIWWRYHECRRLFGTKVSNEIRFEIQTFRHENKMIDLSSANYYRLFCSGINIVKDTLETMSFLSLSYMCIS